MWWCVAPKPTISSGVPRPLKKTATKPASYIPPNRGGLFRDRHRHRPLPSGILPPGWVASRSGPRGAAPGARGRRPRGASVDLLYLHVGFRAPVADDIRARTLTADAVIQTQMTAGRGPSSTRTRPSRGGGGGPGRAGAAEIAMELLEAGVIVLGPRRRWHGDRSRRAGRDAGSGGDVTEVRPVAGAADGGCQPPVVPARRGPGWRPRRGQGRRDSCQRVRRRAPAGGGRAATRLEISLVGRPSCS
jgi:hypothetical protein